MSELAYIGLGSNLENPIDQLQAAIAALGALETTMVCRCSALYRTAPVGDIPQPDFINAVCEIETELAPDDLMRALLNIEKSQGRDRSGAVVGGPRTLDLDLLLYGQIQQIKADLVLPHPRMHQRAFVLYPLAELDAQLTIPGVGTVAQRLANVEKQTIERLAERLVNNG